MPNDRAPRGGKPSKPRAPRQGGAGRSEGGPPARGGKPAAGGRKSPSRSFDGPSPGGAGGFGRKPAPRSADGAAGTGRFAASRTSDGAAPSRKPAPRLGEAPARAPRGGWPSDDAPRGRGPGRSASGGPGRSAPGGRPPRSEGAGPRTPRAPRGEEGAFERKPRVARGDDSRFDRQPREGERPFERSGRTERPAREFDSRPLVAPEGEDEGDMERNDIIFGRHPALAALEGEGAVNKVWIMNGLRNQELVTKVRQLAKEKGASIQMVERPKLDALTLNGNHQGLVVSMAAASYIDLDEAITAALAQEHPALLMLDSIEDPHNLGALIRTAEAAGFASVIIPSRRAVGLTPAAAKASAGAVSRVPVARVGNLAQAADTLLKAGFWLIGADAEGEKLPYELDMTQPIVVVIGSEGKGLARLLSEKCTWRVRLPLGGEMESLNASVAGGILMYEAVRQRWSRQA